MDKPQIGNYKWVVHKVNNQAINFEPGIESYFYPVLIVNIKYLKELLVEILNNFESQIVPISNGEI